MSYPLSNIGEAAFWHLLEREFEIVYWNQNQKEFDRYVPYEEFAGCEWRSYNWSAKDEIEEPNFECLEVRFWWYKYPGRGQESNVDYDGNQWADWLDRAMKSIDKYDEEMY
jgi:hypothetical protein